MLGGLSRLSRPQHGDGSMLMRGEIAVCVFSLVGLFTWLIVAIQYPFSEEMVELLAQF